MDQRDGVSYSEQRGPAPSVSTPLWFLAMFSVAAAFSIFSTLVSPGENPLKPWLAALIPLPALFGWWFWTRHKQHSQLTFVLALAFIAIQFLSTLGQIVVTDEAYRHRIGFMWMSLGVTGLGFLGGLI